MDREQMRSSSIHSTENKVGSDMSLISAISDRLSTMNSRKIDDKDVSRG